MIPSSVSQTCPGVPNVTFVYNGTTVTYATVVSGNGRCWLDRNLGASQVANSLSDQLAYGDLFQWGRLADGHQLRTSGYTNVLSSLNQPGHNLFIWANSSAPYDWRSPQNTSLWQGVSGINNPCPSGWRLPTQSEWETEVLSWSSGNAFDSPLKLTLGGVRSAGNSPPSYTGSQGNYWSSTVSGTGSLSIGVGSGGNTTVGTPGPIWDVYRQMGYSVRCIKD